MTDEEMAEEYAYNKWTDYPEKQEVAEQAYLAGLKAGKDMAEADLATISYMQGAERYKTKWHRISDGDLPKENKLYLVEIKDNGLAIAFFNGRHWETRYNLGDSGHCVETVIAWCEIPKYTEE